MLANIQYNFFESKEETERKALENGFNELEKSVHKVRKALFARNNEISKTLNDINQRLEILEKYICKNSEN